jgi:polyferredoxin
MIRRRDRDLSQPIRRWFQGLFLLLNVVIGVQFYLWVRQLESGSAVTLTRPAGVDGWLPIAGMMNLKAWSVGGVLPRIHPASMVLLVAFLAMSLLLKRAFCSWLCPVGTISELLWKGGRRLFGRNFDLPRWLDVPLRSLKYLLFAFFGWAVLRMPVDGVAEFMASPYGVIADVKLLNFFRFIGSTGLAIVVIFAIASVLVRNFWCRYLCPYGALLSIVSLLSPVRIHRNAAACIDCSKCAKACPSALPVDRKPQVLSAECSLCLECVAVCPSRDALRTGAGRFTLRPAHVAIAVAALFLGAVLIARVTGHWQTDLPPAVYEYLVPRAHAVGH